MDTANQCWSQDKFFATREKVLQAWPTGKDVDFDEALSYHGELPQAKRVTRMLVAAAQEGLTLVQPQADVALVEDHIGLMRYLEMEGADCLPTTVDNYTRQNNYHQAQVGIEESCASQRSMLNGFPAVNYGVDACRRIVESVTVPVQLRQGALDSRLLAEITLAGGFTDFEGGAISYNIPYAKDVPLAKTIEYWQYVDRLVGWYQQQGVEINREPFGPLTGTLVPPAISHAVAILEALLAAEQGVRFLSLGYGQCGNFVQDIAAVQALKDAAQDYLGWEGYDVQVSTVFHQWMGGFPQDEAKAFGLIGVGATVAALAGATKVVTKTPHEAHGIPTKETNGQGIKTTKQIVTMLQGQVAATDAVDAEKEIILAETRSLLENVRILGKGDWAVGAIRAFASGALDIPFAPSKYNSGKLLPARDDTGAVRLLDTGNLPYTAEIKEFHRQKLVERGRQEGRQPSFQMVIDDIYAVGKGLLVGRPQTRKLR